MYLVKFIIFINVKRILFLFGLILASCSADNESAIEFEIVDPNQLEGAKLVRVENSLDGSSFRAQEWIETFSYDSNNKLIEHDEENDRLKKIEYVNSKALQIRTYASYDRALLIFRDSFAYNNDGQFDKIYNFSINAGENVPLSSISEYIYDSDGRLIEIASKRVGGEFSYKRIFDWVDGRIYAVNEYRHEKKTITTEFLIDSKNNYKRYLPIYWLDPINLSPHNVRFSSVTDYTGAYDAVCNDCNFKYVYNAEGYPIEMKTDWGLTKKFFYE